eukprot:CAMPEP_0113487066 /NCGR_PEP_ID=MMETSP0014_2-20120614/25319_1 /TAXON_ID=2857 /ORGANISM="Nitzschia sp." /LENGTH=514 /DNA_ID=CAMNT_0000380755 /DNA_START=284 /DNA_END=1828 /DNA_ORIENTATION=- /assembly_acc=CAM_ASM_000159
MFGWINDCTECLVIEKFGQDVWHQIKDEAGCGDVPDGGFLRYKYYPDSDTVSLVVAAAEVLNITVEDVLHAFGDYFVQYVQDNGYSNVLECLGSNLRDWLSNLNSLHDHLQASYPKGFVAPVFWSEDDEEEGVSGSGNDGGGRVDGNSNSNKNSKNNGAILVHYFSHRGSLLVPLVVGLIKRIAREYFSIEINMEQLQLQDESQGVKNTTWRVMTVDPDEAYKLRGKRKKQNRRSRTGAVKTAAAGGGGNNDGQNQPDGGGGDDEEETRTLSTARTSSPSRYERTFREGQTQASNLRVEEVVKRAFHNPNCELYHAFTKEHYKYLCDYWKVNKTGPDGDQWCYDVYSIDRNVDGGNWVKMEDLPGRLNSSNFDSKFFGGKVPETGAFPPDEEGTLQSFPPKVIIVNDISGSSQEMTVVKDGDMTLEDAVYKQINDDVKQFPPEWLEQLNDKTMEMRCVVWNDEDDTPYHAFSIDDLTMTSTKTFFDLVPPSFDPIKLVLQGDAAVEVGDDEEDI